MTSFKRVRSLARHDRRVRRLISAPGVGAVVALTFVAAIDDPARFRSSKAVGAHFGLTPKKYQSGETDMTGRISKIGDAGVRTMLYEAANVIMTKPVKGSLLDRDPEFHQAYARARELQAEHFVDEITLIANDGRNDFMEKVRRNGETFVDADREHLERSKIRISTRQWIIERILAGKYGPKPQVVVQNNQQNVVSLDPAEAAQLYQKTINGG